MAGPTTLALYSIAATCGFFLMYVFRRYLLMLVMPPIVAVAVYFLVHHFRLHP